MFKLYWLIVFAILFLAFNTETISSARRTSSNIVNEKASIVSLSNDKIGTGKAKLSRGKVGSISTPSTDINNPLQVNMAPITITTEIIHTFNESDEGWTRTNDWVRSSTFTKLGGSFDGASMVTQRPNKISTYTESAIADSQGYATEYPGPHLLISPIYDLSGMSGSDLYISFVHSLRLEPKWDFSLMQYSIDEGANWQVLGSLDDANGINWYNSFLYNSPTSGSYDDYHCIDSMTWISRYGLGDIPQNGFPSWSSLGDCDEGTPIGPDGWVFVQLKVTDPAIARASLIQFRYLAFSDGAIAPDPGGWAFDNFRLGNDGVIISGGTISGTVFHDVDGGGTYDIGEADGSGTKVYLSYFGVLKDSTFTDDFGVYTFTASQITLPGLYNVRASKTGYAWTMPWGVTGIVTVDHPAMGENFSQNLGYYQGSINGTIFSDIDDDGVDEESGEPGLTGWIIELRKDSANGTLVNSAVTDGSGTYTLLAPPYAGDYVVKEVDQASVGRQTYPEIPGTYTLQITGTSGSIDAVYTEKNFGNFIYAILRTEAMIDWDGDGNKELPDQSGLPAGVPKIYYNVYKNYVKIATDTLSDGIAYKEHIMLDKGTYGWKRMNAVPAGWRETTPDTFTIVVDVSSLEDSVSYMYFKYITVSGTMFNDLDKDGAKDYGEPGLSGWTITVTGNGGGQLVTDDNGYYSFAYVDMGSHWVHASDKVGWTQTMPSGAGYSFTGYSGYDKSNMDFGCFENANIEISPASISKSLFTGDSTSQKVTISNTGGSDLNFNIIINNDPSISTVMKLNGVQNIVGASGRNQKNSKIGFWADSTRTKSSIQLPYPFEKDEKVNRAISGIGDVMGTYYNFPVCVTGMVSVGNDIYAVDYCNAKIWRYNIYSQQVTGNISVHGSPYGIAWDGQYLWVGSYGGNVYGYDLNGNNVGSFSCPFSDDISLTWDGQYFIVNQPWQWNPTFYRIDYSGQIIETFTSTFNGNASQIVWVPTHLDGHLWVNNTNQNKIVQINLINGTASFIREFNFYDNSSSYSIGHNGRNLLWSDWNGPLYQLDDGICELLTLNPQSGTVMPDSSMDIDVKFNATNIDSGDYNANILIINNDPDPDQDTVIIPAHLHVTGAPSILITPTNINYDSVFVAWGKSDTFVVKSIGSEPLTVSNITLSSSVFTVNTTNFTLLPNEERTVVVTFMPTDSAHFSGELTVHNNDPTDPQVHVSLQGLGIHPPVIGVDPQSFSFTLTEGDSTISSLTISNTGLGELQFDIENEFIFPPPTQIQRITNVTNVKNEKVTDPYKKYETLNIKEEEDDIKESTVNSINDLGRRLFGVRNNRIYEFDINTGLPIRSIVMPQGDWYSSGLAFSGSRLYYTNNWDQKIYVVDPNSGKILKNYPKPPEFIDGLAYVNGKLYALAPGSNTIYEMSPHDGTVLRTIVPPVYIGGGIDGGDGRLFVSNYGNAIYELSLVDGSVINSFSPVNDVRGIGFCGDTLYTGGGGIYKYNPNTGEYLGTLPQYNYFGSLAGGTSYWLSENPTSGIVQPAGSQQIDLQINAKELHGGTFQANIVINSNDPATNQKIVPASLTVLGVPDISVSVDSVNFDSTYINVGKIDSIIIRNSGTSALIISSITSNNPLFTVTPTSTSIPVGSKKTIYITFIPTGLGDFTGTLTINSNDPDQPTTNVYLTGIGKTPPPSISGDKTVGAGGDFATLEEAFDSINVKYLTDTLRLLLIDPTYNEPQLKLQPAASKPTPPPLIILPNSVNNANRLISSISGAIIYIDSTDSISEVGISIIDAPNVHFNHVNIVLDSMDSWETAVRMEGNCPGTRFYDVNLDGGNAYMGFEVWGNNASLNVLSCDISHVQTGIQAYEYTSLSLQKSAINHVTDWGVWLEISAGNVVIDSNSFNGNLTAEAAIGGSVEGYQMIIDNNTIRNYQWSGIAVDGFAGIEPEQLTLRLFAEKTIVRKSIAEIREAHAQNILMMKDREKRKSIIQQKYSLKKNTDQESISKTSRSTTQITPTVSISGNNVVSDSVRLEFGIWTGWIGEYVHQIAISNNIIQGVSTGIGTDELYGGNLSIEDNNISGFADCAISMMSFSNYYAVNDGSVSILRNNIIQNDTSVTAWAGIYCEGVEAYTYKVEDNNVSGMIEGDGIMAGSFYSPEPYGMAVQQRKLISVSGLSIKERVAKRWMDVKSKDRATMAADVKKRWQEWKSNKKKSVVSLSKVTSSQSLLSIQRNSLTYQGGGGGGISIFDMGGPLDIEILDNTTTMVDGADYGLYIGNMNDPIEHLAIERNVIRNVYGEGIHMDGGDMNEEGEFIVRSNDVETWGGFGMMLGVWPPKVIDISKNIVRGVEPVILQMKQRVVQSKYARKGVIGEEGIIDFSVGSEVDGSTYTMDSNTVSGYNYALHTMPYTSGNVSIDGNILHDGGIMIDYGMASNMTVDGNRIEEFPEGGIQCFYYDQWNQDVPGEVSISTNTIIGSDSSGGWIGIYTEYINAYTLKIEDNSISGNFPGDGIIISGFYSPDPGYVTARRVMKVDATKSTKERVAGLWSEVKSRDRATMAADVKKRWQEWKSNKKKSVVSLSKATSSQSLLSIQRNSLTYQGGGGGGINIFDMGGPLDIEILDNTTTMVDGADYGLYIGNMNDPIERFAIERNVVRNAYSAGIQMDGGEMSEEGEFIVRSNDVETWSGFGMMLGAWPPKVIDISKNTVRGVEPLILQMKQRVVQSMYARKGVIGEEGIVDFSGASELDGSRYTMDSNTVSGYNYALHTMPYTSGHVSIDGNVLHDGGIWIDYAMASNMTVDGNRINEFPESGINLSYYEQWNPDVPGGISMSRNTIVGSDSSGGSIGIYTEEINAYTLRVDDNNISGNFIGDGIDINGFYSPDPGFAMSKRTMQKADATMSTKERVAGLWSKVKSRARTTNAKEAKKLWAEHKLDNKKRVSTSLTGTSTSQSLLSMRRNIISNQGGDGGINVFELGGPLYIEIADNHTTATDNISFGIYLGWMADLIMQIAIERNIIRNSSTGICFEGGDMYQDWTLKVNNNSIENNGGDAGLLLGEMWQAQTVEVKNNNVRSKTISNDGIAIFSGSEAINSSFILSNNEVQNFDIGVNAVVNGFETFSISNNNVHHNTNGIQWEGECLGRSISGGIDSNIVSDNIEQGIIVNLNDYNCPFLIEHNTLKNNGTNGLYIGGSGSTPRVQYNNLNDTAVYSLFNDCEQSVDARNNWWGQTTSSQMSMQAYPSNITKIYDNFDNPSVGFVVYKNWQDSAVGGSSIAGHVFSDLNADGVRDSGEVGIIGFAVFLDLNGDDSLELGETYTSTDINGNYEFFNLGYGTYRVREVQQGGWVRTTPNPLDIVISSDTNVTGIDFGNRAFTGFGYTYVGPSGGTWSSAGNWSGSKVPGPTAFVKVPENVTVFVDSLPFDTIAALEINWRGRLKFDSSVGTLKTYLQVHNDGTIEFPSTGATGMVCFGDWINHNTIIPGTSTIIFTGDNPKLIHSTTFYNLNIAGTHTSTAGNLSVSNQLTLINTLYQRATDTIQILNASSNAIVDTGRIPQGTIIRAIEQGETNAYRFESNQSYVEFDGTGTYPSTLTATAYPDTLPTDFGDEWETIPSVVDTAANIVTANNVTKFSRWPFGFPRPRIVNNVPIIRRIYSIESKGGAGFATKLVLRYDQSEVPPSVREDSLSLFRSVHNDLNIIVSPSWNLVSLPLKLTDGRKTSIFQHASSEAFAYEGETYVSKETLTIGNGYWLKYANPETIMITGKPILLDTFDVHEGWNLMGSLCLPVPTITISSIPSGIMTTNFFGFRGSYFVDDTIQPGNGYWVKVDTIGKLILLAGGISEFNNLIKIVPTSERPPDPPFTINVTKEIPKEFALHQNYPNPFNPLTFIRYQFPVDCRVTLKIYNVLGQEVKTLIDEIQDAGFKSVEWNPSTSSGQGLASGVYFYRLMAESPGKSFVAVKKLLLMK